MADQNKPSYRFDDLSFIGKAVFLTGATVRAVGNVLDYAIEKTVDIAVETEKASPPKTVANEVAVTDSARAFKAGEPGRSFLTK